MKTAAELGTGYIGRCSTCGDHVRHDPLAGRWLHDGGEDGHAITFGRVLGPEEAAALVERVRRSRADYVPDDEDEDGEEEIGFEEIVPPEVPQRLATAAELPKTAKSVIAHAEKHGWAVRATYSRGTPLTAQGRSKMETVKEPLAGENGKPLLSKTGRPRFRNVPTGRPVVHDVVCLAFVRGETKMWASWEDGSYYRGWKIAGWPEKLNHTELRAALAEGEVVP